MSELGVKADSVKVRRMPGNNKKYKNSILKEIKIKGLSVIAVKE